MIPDYNHLYIEKSVLYQRGWTENLISRFLGSADKINFAWHYLNHHYPSEKRCYYLGRVEDAEKDPIFDKEFKQQRKKGSTNIKIYLAERKKTEGLVDRYLENLNNMEKEEFYHNQRGDKEAVDLQ